MLTVKHQTTQGGESIISQAVSVDYQPGTHRLVVYGHGTAPNGKVPPKVVIARYHDGRVFVMNDLGKTVGIYNLNYLGSDT